ncbi:phosphodiesterase [Planctomycetes bacterium MalM25]|nr:phosphodiesterase [Planctomycetes bacterium MalM25]
MLIAIISDTHDDLAMTVTAVELAIQRGAEALFHCGDLSSHEVVAVCSRLRPFYFVFGNHDADVVPDLLQAAQENDACCLEWGGCVELCGVRIGVAHGHMTSDLKPLIEEAPSYLLTGHTHEPAHFQQGPIQRVCPGALFRATPPTFALLNLLTGETEFIEVNG